MNKKILKGFIVIEGLDGSGTTTQLNNISSQLKSIDIKQLSTFEPTDSKIGKFLRKVLSGEIEAEQETIAFLFAADRNEHIYNKTKGIIKELENYNFVISDRYLFSSIAYQSFGADPQLVIDLNSRFPLPEHLIFIDVPVEECQRRIKRRDSVSDIYDHIDYQKKVLHYYNQSINLFKNSEMTVHRIDGCQKPLAITDQIMKSVFNI